MPFNACLRYGTISSWGHSNIPDCNPVLRIPHELSELLAEIMKFANTLNCISNNTRFDPMDYSEVVFTYLHRLLDFAPLGNRQHLRELANLVHLSLVAIMATLLPEYGHNQTSHDLLMKKLRWAISNFTACDGSESEVLLWALFVGHVTVFRNDDQDLICSMVSYLHVKMDLLGWDDVEATLSRLPWIRNIYSSSAVKLWTQVEQRSDKLMN